MSDLLNAANNEPPVNGEESSSEEMPLRRPLEQAILRAIERSVRNETKLKGIKSSLERLRKDDAAMWRQYEGLSRDYEAFKRSSDERTDNLSERVANAEQFNKFLLERVQTLERKGEINVLSDVLSAFSSGNWAQKVALLALLFVAILLISAVFVLVRSLG